MRAASCFLFASLLFGGGCLAYNAECPPDTTPIIGRTESFLDLRHSFVRTREAPIGNLITDAFYAELLSFGADLAIVDSGSIRDQSDCGAMDFIDAGPVSRGLIAEILPFDNKLALVEVTGNDLMKVLEHSVARLGDPGEMGVASQFLQVSHLQFQVDCAGAAQEGNQVGERVSHVAIADAAGSWTPLDAQQTYRIATNTFLADGGDAYLWLRNQHPLPSALPDFVVVATYISTQPGSVVAPAVSGRILLDQSCLEGTAE